MRRRRSPIVYMHYLTARTRRSIERLKCRRAFGAPPIIGRRPARETGEAFAHYFHSGGTYILHFIPLTELVLGEIGEL